MRAIVCSAAVGADGLTLVDRSIPSIGPRDVLIEVMAAGVTVADIMQRRGLYPGLAATTDIPGLEVSGVVKEVGTEVFEWRVGDRVCTIVAGGGYAEYVAAPAEHCLPVPEPWTMIDAASAIGPVCTAWFNVVMLGRLAPNESILVHGGSGGVGTWAVQLFAGLGHQIFATAGGSERCRRVEALGAAHCFDHRTGEIDQALLAATAGKGVDVVLDILGAGALEKNLRMLKEGGRLMGLATQQGASACFDLWTLYRRQLSISGSTLRSQSRYTKQKIVQAVRDAAWPLLSRPQTKVIVDSIWPLERAWDAQVRLEGGGAFGKVVLKVREEMPRD